MGMGFHLSHHSSKSVKWLTRYERGRTNGRTDERTALGWTDNNLAKPPTRSARFARFASENITTYTKYASQLTKLLQISIFAISKSGAFI